MKKYITKIWGVVLVIVLVASLMLCAMPASAGPPDQDPAPGLVAVSAVHEFHAAVVTIDRPSPAPAPAPSQDMPWGIGLLSVIGTILVTSLVASRRRLISKITLLARLVRNRFSEGAMGGGPNKFILPAA